MGSKQSGNGAKRPAKTDVKIQASEIRKLRAALGKVDSHLEMWDTYGIKKMDFSGQLLAARQTIERALTGKVTTAWAKIYEQHWRAQRNNPNPPFDYTD